MSNYRLKPNEAGQLVLQERRRDPVPLPGARCSTERWIDVRAEDLLAVHISADCVAELVLGSVPQ